MDTGGGTIENKEPILLRTPISAKTSALIRLIPNLQNPAVPVRLSETLVGVINSGINDAQGDDFPAGIAGEGQWE